MPPHNEIFKELSYVFIAAIAGGTLTWKLRQPLILGYVVAGIAISPFTPGPSIHGPKTFQVIAEVGVVFLMFSIGLEFSLEELASVKWVALIGGPLGIALSALLGAVSAGCLALCRSLCWQDFWFRECLPASHAPITASYFC